MNIKTYHFFCTSFTNQTKNIKSIKYIHKGINIKTNYLPFFCFAYQRSKK